MVGSEDLESQANSSWHDDALQKSGGVHPIIRSDALRAPHISTLGVTAAGSAATRGKC